MATGGLYGQSNAGIVSPQSGSESSGLYGNNTVFGGTYFEWFIFQESATQPATPTGGSWNFLTNTGTVPGGWTQSPPTNPTNKIWVSIALVNSKTTSSFTWSTPGLFGVVATTTVGTTTTGAAGTAAAVTNSGTAVNAVLNFTVPQGIQGIQGNAATIAAGTTTTTAPGTSASVTNVGTSGNAIFNFGIPRGAGVNSGGTAGQVLTKASGTDYDTTWTTITGTLNYRGTWNASTNTPALASGVGTNGYYYVVNVAGTTNLDGITDWQIGDWAIFNGSTWQKIDQSNTVISVNGYTGAVVLGNVDISGFTNTAASGTVITLTSTSTPNYVITGSGGQTIQLPNATTLQSGAIFSFNNNQSSGTIVVRNNSGTTISTIQSGGYVSIVLLSNATAAGTWDVHNYAPSNVSWSTNTFDYAGSITSATWNGNTVAVNRGGTGQTTTQAAMNSFAGAVTSGNYLRGNGTNVVMSAIQAADVPILNQNTTGTASNVTGTVAIANGGTNGTATPTAGAIPYGSGTAYAFTAAGTTGQVLTSNGAAAPTWSSVSGIAVTSISFGTTGLTPSTASNGAVTVAGTLTLANGGTGATTVAAAQTNLQVDPAGTAVALAIALG